MIAPALDGLTRRFDEASASPAAEGPLRMELGDESSGMAARFAAASCGW